MSTGFGLHADIDAGFAQWLFKKLLLREKPDKFIFLRPGQKYAEADKFDRFIHFDTGGIYDPKRGFFDHHGIPKGNPKRGKCTAILVMEYVEEHLKRQPDEYWTLAQFAQMVDKEKDKSRAEKYNPYSQDPYSAPILSKLPELVALAKRAKVPSRDIITTIDATIAAYLEKRKESREFRHWFRENLEKGTIKIKEETPFNNPALVVAECPYDSGDFRNLINYYHKLYSLIIARYVLKDETDEIRIRYGVNKPEWIPELDLHKVYRVLGEKFPELDNDNDKLFLHNSFLFLYMNQIPNGFTFDEFVKIVLTR